MSKFFSSHQNSDADVQEMYTGLAEVCGSRRYELTEFEARAWLGFLRSVPKAPFLAFLMHHVMHSNFAPTIAEASKAMGLTDIGDNSWGKLVLLVSSHGPYTVPSEFENDPVLRQTVLNLGGWQKVNETMPDAQQTYQVKEFRDRFNGAFNSAVAQVRMQGVKPQALNAIGMSRPALAIGNGSTGDAGTGKRAELSYAQKAVEKVVMTPADVMPSMQPVEQETDLLGFPLPDAVPADKLEQKATPFARRKRQAKKPDATDFKMN